MNDDAELLRRGRDDPAAFRALVDAHAQYLYGVAHALTRNNADAEDLVQETLLGAIRGTFREESSVRTWLVRILVNRAGMLRRTRKRKPTQELAFDVAASAKPQAEESSGGSSGSGGLRTVVRSRCDRPRIAMSSPK